MTTTLCDCSWAVVQCRPRTKSECPFVDLPVRNLGESTHTGFPLILPVAGAGLVSPNATRRVS